MADYTNYLARKVNGAVAQALLKGGHEVYNSADEWLNYRARLSVDNAQDEDLDALGTIVGAPRPYAMTEDGEVVYAEDDAYRRFIYAIAYLRRAQSLRALADMLAIFVPNGRFELEITANGDIGVTVDQLYATYLPFLQTAANAVYTALPRLQPFETKDYHWYIYRNVFRTDYVYLDQPNFWQFSFEGHTGYITSADPANAEVNPVSQSYTPFPSKVNFPLDQESLYVAYTTPYGTRQINGLGLGMRLPLNPPYTDTAHADPLVEPATLETDTALGQYGARIALDATTDPPTAVFFTRPDPAHPTLDVTYGDTADLPRVKSAFDATTHTCTLEFFDTKFLLNMTVTQQ